MRISTYGIMSWCFGALMYLLNNLISKIYVPGVKTLACVLMVFAFPFYVFFRLAEGD